MYDIGLAGSIVVIGEDLPVTQPIVGLQVHRAVARGATLTTVEAGKGRRKPLDLLETSKPALVLFGPGLLEGKQGLLRLAELWNHVVPRGGRLIALDREANMRGGSAIAEAFPARAARRRPRALYLAGPRPKLAPGEADLVILQASFHDENTDLADIVLPEATSFEAEGTFVNVEGRIQFSAPAAAPAGEARPGWRILRELADRLGAPRFGYDAAADVRTALAAAVPALTAAASRGAVEGTAFLAEGPAGPAAAIDLEAIGGLGRRRADLSPRDPDDYKGLRLAAELKGLKLVRGR